MTQGAENDLYDISYYGEPTPVNFSDDMLPLTGATTSINANTLLVDAKAILARDTANTVASDLASHKASLGISEHAIATTISPGFMSAGDKLKLDSVQDGAQVNVMSPIDALELISRKSTTLHRHPAGTSTTSGFLSDVDKTKLDSIEVLAEDNNIGLTSAGILTGGGIADTMHGHGFTPAGETFTEAVHSGTSHSGVNGVPGFPGFNITQHFISSAPVGSGTLVFTHTYPFPLQTLACGVKSWSVGGLSGWAGHFGIDDISISGNDGIVTCSTGAPLGSSASLVVWQGGFGVSP